MTVTNEYVLELQQLNRRMDNIEKLMNMILLNDLIDDVEGVTRKRKKYKERSIEKREYAGKDSRHKKRYGNYH